MNTRQTTRNIDYTDPPLIDQSELSDTEEMDDDDDDDGNYAEDSDSQDILFIPQRRNRHRYGNVILDTEEGVDEDNEEDAIVTSDTSDDEDMEDDYEDEGGGGSNENDEGSGNNNDGSENNEESNENGESDQGQEMVDERPSRQIRYFRIYFPDAEEHASDNEVDHRAEEGDTATTAVYHQSDESDSASVGDGRVSPDRDAAMGSDDDSDITEIPNVEEVSRQFINGNGEEVSIPAPVTSLRNERQQAAEEIIERPAPSDDNHEPQKPIATNKKPKTDAGLLPSTSTVHEDEGQLCPICFESWSNCGEHRIVSLKCGHLFGKMCIEKWLKGQGSKCPQCNSKASKKDIRVIYAKVLKVEDTSEKERMNKEIQKLNRIKAQYEKEQAQQRTKIKLDNQLIRRLQEELRMLKESVKTQSGSSVVTREGVRGPKHYKLALLQSLNVIKTGNCRVMAYNDWMSMLVVSVPSQVALFHGFGVKKINTVDLGISQYVPLHSKQIRDLAFSPSNRELLLSVSLDKAAKVTNMSSGAAVATYRTDWPLWACCWNTDKVSEFFAGTSAGTVLHFDTAKSTSEPVSTYNIAGTGPVVSMCYVPLAYDKDCLSGLIVTRLSSISFVEIVDGQISDHLLPLEGPFSHTVFDPASRHFLTTCRPSARYLHARHVLCELKILDVNFSSGTITKLVSANEIYCFQGSTTMKVLSRACLTSKPDEKEISTAIISEESTNSFKVYDVSTASLRQSHNVGTNIIDILPVKGYERKYVAMLTDTCVRIFQWIETLST